MCVRYSQLVTFALKKKGLNSVLYLSFQKRRKLNSKDKLYLHHSLELDISAPGSFPECQSVRHRHLLHFPLSFQGNRWTLSPALRGVQTFIQGAIGSGAGAAAEICSWQPSGQGVPIGPMCLEPEPAESSPLAVLWEAGMRGTRLPLLIPSQGEATSWPFPAGL